MAAINTGFVPKTLAGGAPVRSLATAAPPPKGRAKRGSGLLTAVRKALRGAMGPAMHNDGGCAYHHDGGPAHCGR